MTTQTPGPEPKRPPRAPSYLDAILPMLMLIVLIAGSVFMFGAAAIDGPMQVALILTAAVSALIVLKNGHSWEEVVQSGKEAFASIITPIFILLAVGALIGTWNMSGTIPTMVFYGIKLLAPKYFYFATAVVCGLIAMGIGSSWTTVGTIGVGLVGLAGLIGVSPAITAGAVISGAYLGDKLSPISETTVLTAQLAGVEIGQHLKNQFWTSGPAFGIALVVFGLLGLRTTVAAGVDTGGELVKLDELFRIGPLNLLPLALLVYLSVRKVPASLAILGSAIFGGVLAFFTQHDAILRFVDDRSLSTPTAYVKGMWLAMATGYKANSGIAVLDSLLSRGGMASMLKTLWIIIGAVTLGSLLERFQLLTKLIGPILRKATSPGSLIAATVLTAFGLNVVAADQYIALVLPVRLFRAEFEKQRLDPRVLSRSCADGGTVSSALIPWNSCGAFMAATLGVGTLSYLPFAVFNIASPLLSILWGFTGFKVQRRPPAGAKSETGSPGPRLVRKAHA